MFYFREQEVLEFSVYITQGRTMNYGISKIDIT